MEAGEGAPSRRSRDEDGGDAGGAPPAKAARLDPAAGEDSAAVGGGDGSGGGGEAELSDSDMDVGAGAGDGDGEGPDDVDEDEEEEEEEEEEEDEDEEDDDEEEEEEEEEGESGGSDGEGGEGGGGAAVKRAAGSSGQPPAKKARAEKGGAGGQQKKPSQTKPSGRMTAPPSQDVVPALDVLDELAEQADASQAPSADMGSGEAALRGLPADALPAERSDLGTVDAAFDRVVASGARVRVLDDFCMLDAGGKAVPLERLVVHGGDQSALRRVAVFGSLVLQESRGGTVHPRSRRDGERYEKYLPDRLPPLFKDGVSGLLPEVPVPKATPGGGRRRSTGKSSRPRAKAVMLPPGPSLPPPESHAAAAKLLASQTFPFKPAGSVTVIELGRIDPAPGFHCDKYIWPIGYKSSRQYTSYLDPMKKVTYYNRITAGSDGPTFKVTAEDDPTRTFSASAPSAAWQQVMRKVVERKTELGMPTRQNVSVSGPEFFGYAQPMIARLIEGMAGALECTEYVFREHRATRVASRAGSSRSASKGKAKAKPNKKTEAQVLEEAIESTAWKMLASDRVSLKEVRRGAEKLLGRKLSDHKALIKTVVFRVMGQHEKGMTEADVKAKRDAAEAAKAKAAAEAEAAEAARQEAANHSAKVEAPRVSIGIPAPRQSGGAPANVVSATNTFATEQKKSQALEKAAKEEDDRADVAEKALANYSGPSRVRIVLRGIKGIAVTCDDTPQLVLIGLDDIQYRIAGVDSIAPEATYRRMFDSGHRLLLLACCLGRSLRTVLAETKSAKYTSILDSFGALAGRMVPGTVVATEAYVLLLAPFVLRHLEDLKSTAFRPVSNVYGLGRFSDTLKRRATAYATKVEKAKARMEALEERRRKRGEERQSAAASLANMSLMPDLEAAAKAAEHAGDVGLPDCPAPSPVSTLDGDDERQSLSRKLSGELVTMWACLKWFAPKLLLKDFTLDDFVDALQTCDCDSALLAHIHVSLLRIIGQDFVREEKEKEQKELEAGVGALDDDLVDDAEVGTTATRSLDLLSDISPGHLLETLRDAMRTPRGINAGNFQEVLRSFMVASLSHRAIDELTGADADGDAAAAAAAAEAEAAEAKRLARRERPMKLCGTVLTSLMASRDAQAFFNSPVDPEGDGIPDYTEKISDPMDLGTIKKRLKSGYYRPLSFGPVKGDVDLDKLDAFGGSAPHSSHRGFASDVRLAFKNCQVYNPYDSAAYSAGDRLSRMFETAYRGRILPAAAAAAVAAVMQSRRDNGEDDGAESDDSQGEEREPILQGWPPAGVESAHDSVKVVKLLGSVEYRFLPTTTKLAILHWLCTTAADTHEMHAYVDACLTQVRELRSELRSLEAAERKRLAAGRRQGKAEGAGDSHSVDSDQAREEKQEADAAAAAHKSKVEAIESEISTLLLRAEPLGYDRDGRRYWAFFGELNAGGRLFVEDAVDGSLLAYSTDEQLDKLSQWLLPTGRNESVVLSTVKSLRGHLRGQQRARREQIRAVVEAYKGAPSNRVVWFGPISGGNAFGIHAPDGVTTSDASAARENPLALPFEAYAGSDGTMHKLPHGVPRVDPPAPKVPGADQSALVNCQRALLTVDRYLCSPMSVVETWPGSEQRDSWIVNVAYCWDALPTIQEGVSVAQSSDGLSVSPLTRSDPADGQRRSAACLKQLIACTLQLEGFLSAPDSRYHMCLSVKEPWMKSRVEWTDAVKACTTLAQLSLLLDSFERHCMDWTNLGAVPARRVTRSSRNTSVY